jgi:hypothetical protein
LQRYGACAGYDMHMWHPLRMATVIITTALGSTACHAPPIREIARIATVPAPYPPSGSIAAVSWDFSPIIAPRRALGSDLWPCTWARDDNQYCAWGDGGGFDGNDDHVGRVSVGIARITGTGRRNGSLQLVGKNVWGEPPYAEYPATFGGKISSLISVGGVLYASGGFWTSQNTADPVHSSEQGPLNTLAWSADLGKTWQLAPWSTASSLGTFINFGRDNAAALDHFVYLYYCRPFDSQHIYLKRVPQDRLRSDPSTPGLYEYLTAVDAHGRALSWSTQEPQAGAIFFDGNNVNGPEAVYDFKLQRFILTVGHFASGRNDDSSIGQLGVFESHHPWGPWATVGYYDDWGSFGPSAAGDFLGLHVLAKWMGFDGKTLWCVFSGVHEFDAFTLVKGTLETKRQ